MRLLLITDRYAPEARSAAVLYQELAEALAVRGHDVWVLTKLPTDYVPPGPVEGSQGSWVQLPRFEHLGGVTVMRVRGLSSKRTSILYRGFQQSVLMLAFALRLSRTRRPDAILVYSPPLLVSLAAGFYGRLARVPFVLNLHDIYPRTAIQLGLLRNPLIIWAARCLEALVYRFADEIVVPAPTSRTILVNESGVPERKIHFVPNWVDTEAFRPASKHNRFRRDHGLDGRFVVTYAGLMGFAQDLTTVIECARTMQSRAEVVFLLIGEGVFADRWKRLAAGLDNVRFLPMQPKEEYYQALVASDACLVVLAERLASPAVPGKIQSIMAVGRPVLATVPEKSDAAAVIRDSGCGFVVEPGDVDGLRRALERLSQDPALCESLGSKGREFAETRFTLTGSVSQYERILAEAASRYTRRTTMGSKHGAE